MSEADELLRRWLKRARENVFAHLAAAEMCSKRHHYLGVPAAILAAVVGTTVFASLDSVVDPWVKIAVGLTSILAAVLAALQTFLRFAERAERHRVVAGQYSSIRRHIEQLLTLGGPNLGQEVSAIRISLDELSLEAPNVTPSVWAKALKLAGSDYLFASKDAKQISSESASSASTSDQSQAASPPAAFPTDDRIPPS